MVRVISQETFDSVVKENEEEFEMSRAEAIQEAISQFESQGVNLANIVTSTSEGKNDHAVVVSLDALKSVQDLPIEKAESLCDVVKDECSKGLAEKMLATKNQGYEILTKVAVQDDRESVQLKAVAALVSLLSGNPDPFDEHGFGVIRQCLESSSSEASKLGLEFTLAVCVRHEQNRQNLMKNKILEFADQVYGDHPVDVARLWQALVQDDDVRVPYGKAHENARTIVEDHDAQTKLLASMKAAKNPSPFLSCLSSLTVRNEYCQSLADKGGLDSLFEILANPDSSAIVNKDALLLMKSMAGNDDIKRDIRASGKIGVIVSIISNNMANRGICHAGCSLITAMCLRMPQNAEEIVAVGGDEVLVQVLKTHMDQPKVAVAAISAMRNVVSRSKHLAEGFTRLGVEELLGQTLQLHPQAAEDCVKAALRDMGLKVHLKEEWTQCLTEVKDFFKN